MLQVVKRRFQVFFPTAKHLFVFLIFVMGVFCLAGVGYLNFKYHLSPSRLLSIITGNSGDIKQSDNRTNILLLGIGGKNHDGGELTDTIMIMSIGLKTHDTVLIAIPRDIWVPTLKEKINAAYAVGEIKTPGAGLVLSKSAVEEVTSLPIHYAVLVDFAGFTKMIDDIGGVDVTVAESFSDPLYPVAGRENDLCSGDKTYACRYENITFTAGVEHMNGDRVLKYVRSRHASGDAGTDFSRGRRQQAVLLAIKNKLLKNVSPTGFSKLKQFLDSVNQTLKTDMSLGELGLVARLFLQANQKTRSVGLAQDIPEKDIKGLLINPPLWQYSGKWVLVPKHADFGQVGKFVKCVIETPEVCDPLLD